MRFPPGPPTPVLKHHKIAKGCLEYISSIGQVYIKMSTFKMSTIKMSTFSKCWFDMSKCRFDMSKCQLDMSKCWFYMSKCRLELSKCRQSEQKVDTSLKCRQCHYYCKRINSNIGIFFSLASGSSAKLNFFLKKY